MSVETVKKHCKYKNCIYRGYLEQSRRTPTCDYILYTGMSRNCPISQCDKYKKGKRKKTMDYNGFKAKMEFNDE